MDKIKIVAAILDTNILRLYKDDGNIIEIKQGDSRVQRIINEVTTPLSTQGWAEITLDQADPEKNDYREFEQKTTGVKFFRVAKKFLKGLFHSDKEESVDDGTYGVHNYVAPVSLGSVPVLETTKEQIVDAVQTSNPGITSAISQIMAQAKPVSDPDYNSSHTDPEEHTMIAQVTDQKTGETQIVPGMEHLQAQFRNATKLGSTEGVTNFLRRIAAVISDRGHTIDELLRFMNRGDLPIADDGSIVAYKVLQSVPSKKGYYVDCHSKQVTQRVGSYVTQAKVDASRRTECSTGLHIARRGYLSGFHGDIITLVKIAPEDVIAVPLGEPNKMRARGYHILSEIPSIEHSRLRSNQPLEGVQAKQLLGMALKGQHIGIIEDVVIGGPRGAGVVVTLRDDNGAKVAPAIRKDAPVAEAIETDLKKVDSSGPVIDPKAAMQASIEQKQAPVEVPVETVKVETNVTATVVETRAQKIQRLLGVMNSNALFPERLAAAQELVAIKKITKKPWIMLGVDLRNEAIIKSYLNTTETVAKTPVVDETKPDLDDAFFKEADQYQGDKLVRKGEPAAPVVEPKKEVVPAGSSNQTVARAFFNALEFHSLREFKKKKKVGWDRLGFSEAEITKINAS